MNNLQINCQGNCFTKPLLCWSLLDYLIAIGGIILILAICVVVQEKGKK